MKNVLDKNSMLYWWPKIKGLASSIPMPRTEILRLDSSVYTNTFEDFLAEHGDNAKKIAAEIGYPLFIRTDHVSGKHDWQDTCFVKDGGSLIQHIYNIVEFSEMVDMLGIPVRAIVFREYIEMASIFTAFAGHMPVNPERRYFVRDGRVVCHYAYWVPDAIEDGTPAYQLPDNWRVLLDEANKESDSEILLLTAFAEMVSRHVEGYWSVDFCKVHDDNVFSWYMIDMAEGEKSWHPPCIQTPV